MTSVDEEMAACDEKPFRLFQWSSCKQTAATKTSVKGPAARKKPAATKAMKGTYAKTTPAAAHVKKKPAHKRNDKSDDAADEDAGDESHESRESVCTDDFADPCEPDLRRLSTLERMRLPTLEFGTGATCSVLDAD